MILKLTLKEILEAMYVPLEFERLLKVRYNRDIIEFIAAAASTKVL